MSKILGPGATECQLVASGVKDGQAARYRLRGDLNLYNVFNTDYINANGGINGRKVVLDIR